MIRFIGVDLKLKDLTLKYFAFTILILSIGCTKKTVEAGQPDTGIAEKSLVEANVKQESDSIGIDFKNFIVRFSRDSVYQSQHVKFPLKVTKIADPVISRTVETNDSIYTINKSQYRLLNLVNPSSENYGDVVSIITYPENKKMMVEVSGKEGRIHLEYLFYRQNKEWFLKEIIDYNL